MAAVFEEDARLRAPTIGIEAEMIGAKKLLEGGLLVTRCVGLLDAEYSPLTNEGEGGKRRMAGIDFVRHVPLGSNASANGERRGHSWLGG